MIQMTKPICCVSLFDSGQHACLSYLECLAYVCRALIRIKINFVFYFFLGGGADGGGSVVDFFVVLVTSCWLAFLMAHHWLAADP